MSGPTPARNLASVKKDACGADTYICKSAVAAPALSVRGPHTFVKMQVSANGYTPPTLDAISHTADYIP